MILKQEYKDFLMTNLTTLRSYTLKHNDVLHIIDSRFIIAEILDSSDDELYTIMEILKKMEPSQDNIHRFLCHMAAMYILVHTSES